MDLIDTVLYFNQGDLSLIALSGGLKGNAVSAFYFIKLHLKKVWNPDVMQSTIQQVEEVLRALRGIFDKQIDALVAEFLRLSNEFSSKNVKEQI